MTRMTGPDCVVMCNLINTHTHTHTHNWLEQVARRLHETILNSDTVTFQNTTVQNSYVVLYTGRTLASACELKVWLHLAF